jgi:type IV secretory pathway VirB10-like protein
MNFRLLVSIAVPVLAFALTVAVSLWQRRAAEPAPPPPAPYRPVAESVAPPPPAQAKPPPVTSEEASPPPPPVQADSDPGQISVPARLSVHARDGQQGVLATLQNTTADELDVTLTAVSAKTLMRTVVDVSLQPFERRNLANAGLELGLGDKVTLQSAPYRDLTVVAR